MGHVTNVTIKKVYKGKSGEGAYGPWQAWDVYFDGSDNKYSYFSGGKKPVPVVGQKIAFLEFEAETTQKDGKTYTNRTIKKMILDETPSNESQDAPESTNESKAYIDQGECVLALMKMAGGKDCDVGILETLIHIFRTGIKAMIAPYGKANSTKAASEEFDSSEPPPITDDDIPF